MPSAHTRSKQITPSAEFVSGMVWVGKLQEETEIFNSRVFRPLNKSLAIGQNKNSRNTTSETNFSITVPKQLIQEIGSWQKIHLKNLRHQSEQIVREILLTAVTEKVLRVNLKVPFIMNTRPFCYSDLRNYIGVNIFGICDVMQFSHLL